MIRILALDRVDAGLGTSAPARIPIDQQSGHRPDIRDRATLEANFRGKFQELNRVTLTDGEFQRLLDEIVSADVFTAAHTLRNRNAFTRDDGTPLNYTLVNINDWCKNTFEVVSQPPKANRISALQSYALCLQTLHEDAAALDAAREIIKLDPKSKAALQARSIILDLEGGENRDAELRKLEVLARKRGAIIVANNIVLNRVRRAKNADGGAIDELNQVVKSALQGGDRYSAWQATVKIAKQATNDGSPLSIRELRNTVQAYHYFYDQRFDNLFLQAHEVLWTIFERDHDIGNLLQLFRHSSFIWRLSGFEKREHAYIEKLTKIAANLRATDVLTADTATAYFLARSAEFEPLHLIDQTTLEVAQE